MAIAAGVQAACGPLRSRTPQRGEATVVLLTDADGSTGRAGVSNTRGDVELATPRASTRVIPGRRLRVRQMSESDVQRMFADAFAAQPPVPTHFVLNFRFDSEELTDDSRKLVTQVLQAVKTYPAPHVTVVGHTDTTGAPSSNVELGLRRANVVRALLVDIGIDASAIDVTSHGEATLLVPTADEVFEPKNRRVDITVR